MTQTRQLISSHLHALLVLGIAALGPCGAWAAELTTIATDGFSVSLPGKWMHLEVITTHNKGRIYAGPKGEEPPGVSIEYVYLPEMPTPEESSHFKAFQKTAFQDGFGGIKKIERQIEQSSWHSGREAARLMPGISVDRQDIEMKRTDEKSIEAVSCFFLRRYHAPRAEVSVMVAVDKTCTQARTDFQEVEASFHWK